MPASNVFQIGLGIQSAKGATPTTPSYWLDVTGSDLGPQPESERRSETGLGVDVGGSYIRVLGAGGSANVILRPSTAPLIFYGILGTKAVTGAGPYTHTITAASTKPFFTVWRSLGGQLWEVFRDCQFTGVNVQWGAGGDVTADCSITGLSFTRLTSAPVGGTYDATEAPFRVPGYVSTINSVVQANISEGNVNFEWGSTPIQTNAITNSYLEPGAREISGSWNEVWEAVGRYAEVYYGSAAGTAASSTQFIAPFSFVFPHVTAGHSLTLAAQRFAFQSAGATPDPGGDPLRVPIAGTVERPTSGSIATVTIGNAVATYPNAS